MNNLRKAFVTQKIAAVMLLISGVSFAESFTGWSPEIRADTRTVAVENLRIGFESNHRIAIRYALVAAFGNATVTISVSTDGGGSYQNLASTDFDAGAAMGSGVLAGSEKLARWRADQTFPDNQYANVRIKVAAQSSTRSHHQVSSIFSIDTRLLQNLTLESIGVPPTPLAGRNHVFPVNVTAMQKPDVSVKLRITENSLPVSVIRIDPADWTLSGDRWRAEAMVGWQPQALECRDTVLMATIDPPWENVVEETDENDNSRDAVVRLRVRERIGTAHGNTVYGDVRDRAAFDQALAQHGDNLAAALVSGSVEVENDRGRIVRDPRIIASTLNALAETMTEPRRSTLPRPWFSDLPNTILPTVYDGSLLWGITDPMGDLAEMIIPNLEKRADARCKVLLSAVLQKGSEYDLAAFLADGIPALFGVAFVVGDIGDLADANTSLLQDSVETIAFSGTYSEYLKAEMPIRTSEIVFDDAHTTVWNPQDWRIVSEMFNQMSWKLCQETTVVEMDALSLAKQIFSSASEALVKDWSADLVAAGMTAPEKVSLEELYRWRAAQMLEAVDKIRAFRSALEGLGTSKSGGDSAELNAWIAACGDAIDILESRYRQYAAILNPASNPDMYASLAGNLAGALQKLVFQLPYTVGQSVVKTLAKTAIKEAAIHAASMGSQALSATLGAVSPLLIGVEIGQLLTNQSAVDRCRNNIFDAGGLIDNYLDEAWYLAAHADAATPDMDAVCELLESLRWDLTAYTCDQAAMIGASGFYGVAGVFFRESIEGYRKGAETYWKVARQKIGVHLPRERLLHELLASCRDFSLSPDPLDGALPDRSMNPWASISTDTHAGGWGWMPGSIRIDSSYYRDGAFFADGRRRLFLRPSWAYGTFRFAGRLEMEVKQFAEDGTPVSIALEPADGGLRRAESARDGYYWDPWAVALEPATHSVCVSLRGGLGGEMTFDDWLKAPPNVWLEVAAIDCAAGCSPQAAGAMPIPSATAPLALPVPLDEPAPAVIAVTNAVPFDADGNGIADAVRILGEYTLPTSPPRVYLGVRAAAGSNLWHSLYGPFAGESGATHPLAVTLAGVHASSNAVAQLSLLNSRLAEIAAAEPVSVAFDEPAPSNCAPRLVSAFYEHTPDGQRGSLDVTWSLIAEQPETEASEVLVVVQARDTNGVVAVATLACLAGSSAPSVYSATLPDIGVPASVTLRLADERHVLVDALSAAPPSGNSPMILAAIPQAAEDVDGDGVADRIPVRILLSEACAGSGSLLLTCTDGAGRTLHEQTFLVSKSDPGDAWVTVNLSVEPLTFSGVVPPWQLASVRGFDAEGALLSLYAEGVALETPAGPLRPSVRFTGSNVCSVVSGDGGNPEFLRIALGIESDRGGTLRAVAALDSAASNRLGSATVAGQAVEAGEGTLVFDYALSALAAPVPGGPYRIHSIDVWRDGAGRIGTFLDGFEIGHAIEAEDLIRPAFALSDPVAFQWVDSAGDGFNDRIAVSIAAFIPAPGSFDLELLCVGGAVTNTLRLQDVNVSTGQTVIAAQFPAADLQAAFAATGSTTFKRARLCTGATLLAEHAFSRLLEAEGPIGAPAVLDAIEVVSWTPRRDEPGGPIEALEVEVRWNCSGPTPFDATLTLAPIGGASGWACQESVAAVSGLNSATFSYPGWMFWHAGVSNAIVARRFEARNPDGYLLGSAENFATSAVWNASEFAAIDLPDLAFGAVEALPVIDQAGVAPGEERVRLQAVVRNVGSARAETFTGAAGTDTAEGILPLAHASVPALGAGEQWLWEMDVVRPRGEHLVRLELDPDERVLDRDRTQNIHTGTLLIPLDTDGDGLPDLWEYRHFNAFQAASPDLDPDGDGAPNWHEYRAGTDPTDPACVFAIRRLLRSEMKWNAVPGKRYRVWWTDTLGHWPPGQSLPVGETDTWTPPPTENSVRFFRLSIEEDPE